MLPMLARRVHMRNPRARRRTVLALLLLAALGSHGCARRGLDADPDAALRDLPIDALDATRDEETRSDDIPDSPGMPDGDDGDLGSNDDVPGSCGPGDAVPSRGCWEGQSSSCDPLLDTAWAGYRCSGSEFETVSAARLTGLQVAALTDGRFVIVGNAGFGDAAGMLPQGQILRCDGVPDGPPFALMASPEAFQPHLSDPNPSVAALDHGAFAAAWHMTSSDIDTMGIYARVFRADGQSDGEFRVNSDRLGPWTKPRIASFADGGFLVIGTGYSLDQPGIGARRYRSDGTPEGETYPVVEYPAGTASTPSVAVLRDQSYVAVWSISHDFVRERVYGRRMLADGGYAGEPWEISAPLLQHHTNPTVAPLAGGGYVVAWTGGCTAPAPGTDGPPCDDGLDGSFLGVFARSYGPDDHPLGEPRQINVHTLNSQRAPSIGVLPGDRVLVLWMSACDFWDKACAWPAGEHAGMFARLDPWTDPSSPDVDVACFHGPGAGEGRIAISPSGAMLLSWSALCPSLEQGGTTMGRLCLPSAR